MPRERAEYRDNLEALLIAQYKSRMKAFAHTVKALESSRQIEGQMEL